ncbi:MAG: hypothetical protein AB8B55_20810 [Mariniblastus sp.]
MKILFNITHGFQARMLLRSTIASTLLDQGAELVISSVNADEEYFQQEFEHPQIALEKMPNRRSATESRMLNIRQYVLMNPSLGGTLNYKREALKRERPKRYFVSRMLNLVFGRMTLLRNGYMKMESALFPGKEFDELLNKHKPDLVVTGTPGFNLFDVHLLRACKRKKIKTTTVMLSWDNLTSKGFMNGVPDHLLVWSDLMADEAVKYHDYPRENIQWTGAAQFDIYGEYQNGFDAKKWKSENGIPADRQLMVYGTINPAICPHEIEIVNSIIRVIKSGKLSKKVHLWIRLHPQVVQGPFKKSLQPFLDLESEFVHVEVPPVREGALNWDLPKSDSHHLASLLTAADILGTTSSTLSIDAACVDTPVINLFYDGIDVKPEVSVARFKKYTHYAIILETGGIRSVHDEQELADAMERYLTNPASDKDKRQAIIEQQLGRLDGESGRRTAIALQKLANTAST